MVSKEHIVIELREILGIIIYLLISFSILATFKSLILIQAGVNNWVHGYMQALVASLALSKVVFLAQKLPLLNAMQNRRAIYAVIYKAIIFTIITTAASQLEEMIFQAHLVKQEENTYPVLAYMTHTLGMFLVFFILFIFRELDNVLGHGRLKEIFLNRPASIRAEKAMKSPPERL
jgi:hypothetical protein